MNAKLMIAVLATLALIISGVAAASSAVDANTGNDAGNTSDSDTEVGTDDSSGEIEATVKTISYIVGTTTYTREYNNSIVLESLEDLGITAPAGQTFMGWYVGTLEDGTAPSQTYAAGSIYTGAETTFTAFFKADTYTVQFIDSDGSVIDETTATYGAEVSVPTIEDDETRNDGMVFTGWNLNGEPAVLKDGKVTITGNSVFVATYEKDITITFVVDGITTYTHVMTGITYPSDPSKESFTFIGWSVGGTVVLKAGSTVADLRALDLDTDTRFTAVFEPAIYTVSFTVGDDTVATQTVKHGETATEPAFVPVMDGMEFVGWTVDGKAYDFAAPVTGDIVLMASFQEIVVPVDYSVTFVIDGLAIDGGTVSKMVIPSDPTKEGYAFVGWSLDGTTIVDPSDAAGAADGPITLTAVWRVMTYAVAFVSEGETVLTQTVPYGGIVTEPSMVPIRDGFDFGGWMVDGAPYDFAAPVTGDVTLTAAWTETPEPAPTGLSDPTVQIMAIVIGVLAIFIVAVLVWKKDDVKVVIVKRLDKSRKQEDPKQ